MNNYILVVLDSCRYDSFLRAEPRAMARLGTVEQRYSYASWTAPSHYNLLMGLMPHCSPRRTIAAEYYRREFFRFNERLGVDHLEFKSFVPKLYLPLFLKERLGYATHAMVSLPVLNPRTILNQGFDTYTLMPAHNDMLAMVRAMRFAEERPSFFVLNVGETHYPYSLPYEDSRQFARIQGLHGVLKHFGDVVVDAQVVSDDGGIPTAAAMREMQDRQVAAVRYLDRIVEELVDVVPDNTYITITSDHGELFGEDGYFGHGPILHPKVLEVPFVEGKVR
ncbi:sulfatase-like hydrolase/transferase [Bradyrhizobium diazoefficiens]|uniref:sulfatase-like hydrolase/transferase n=1 Tax=Bradyrhizobium diazoefficiens TaxID=1355477 RepID=UPI001B8BCDB2|nr:sulfatase-like hydrolase/transferase [Bradyrhizobium diazoefficiens]MBR0865902.1 sulfatase-like hydrolase/transferase [Bradyrhizobium diazoefficiens]MBR0890432.1 sulfatase-like hydrolase/transferase [Bradyrhizobium diazoefficiens]MBR0922202.1 sulfatase-like hydrolase/transferase [Bradyrhizobium diazoefficiens]